MDDMEHFQLRSQRYRTLNMDINETMTCPATSLIVEEHLVYNYIIPCICAIGILCNILNLIVLTDKSFTLSTFTYIRALSVTDMLTLMIISLIGISRCLSCYGEEPSNYWRRFYEIYIYLPINNITGTISVWLTVALAAERYIFIKFPVLCKHYCTVKKAHVVIAALSVGGVVMNYHNFFIFSINDCFQLEQYSLANSTLHQVITAQSWIKAVLVNYLSLVALVVLSILLMSELKGPLSRQKTISTQDKLRVKRQKLQKRLTVMLVVLIFFFLVGNIPIVLAQAPIARKLFTEDLKSYAYLIYRLVSNCLELLTFSLNFFIYCVFNKRFSEVFCSKVCRKKCAVKPSLIPPTHKAVSTV